MIHLESFDDEIPIVDQKPHIVFTFKKEVVAPKNEGIDSEVSDAESISSSGDEDFQESGNVSAST